MVKGGVFGHGKRVCGSIYAKFFENVSVEAGQIVVVGTVMLTRDVK